MFSSLIGNPAFQTDLNVVWFEVGLGIIKNIFQSSIYAQEGGPDVVKLASN